MLSAYLVVSIILSVLSLLFALIALAEDEHEGAAISFIHIVVAWAWPVTVPIFILFGIWSMVVFVLKTLWDVEKPKGLSDFLWLE